MSGPVLRIDPLTDPRWPALAERAPNALVFHTPAWIALLRDQYGYACHALLALDAAGEPAAGLPICRVTSPLTGKRLVALPFSDLCPPLSTGDDAADTALAAALLAHPADEGLDLEVRGALRDAPEGSRGARFLHHLLDLSPGADAVLAAAHSQNRRGAKKAAKAAVTVRRATDRSAIDAFYRLHTATRRRQGVPVQPRSFIRRLETLFAEGLGHVALAEHEGAVAAAAVFVGYGRTVTYKYGASDEAHLAVRPNNAIFAETIRWACDQGFAALDFGRTDLDNPGLAAFKRNWGAEEHAVSYVRLPPRGDETDHEPGAARRLAGAVIRRSPPVVGRAIGAALYRHFG